MTPHIPEEFLTRLVDGPFTAMHNATPPRDPIDEDDDDDEEQDDEDDVPPVVREPDPDE